MSNDFEWIERHIEHSNNKEGWIEYFQNKFNGLHPEKTSYGVNNLEETLALRKDVIEWGWFDGNINKVKLLETSEHPQLMWRNDLSIITFEEYMDYINVWTQ